MQFFSKYFHKILHYAAGKMFNNIILVIFLPIFSHYMVPDEYAVYTNITIFISFANIFYSMGLAQSLLSFFYQQNSDDYRFTLINSTYIVIGVAGILFSILILSFENTIANLILKSDQYAYLFDYIVIIIFAQSFYSISLSILNKLERSANYAFLGGVSNSVLLILFIYGAVSGNFSISNVISYIAISSITSMLAALINMNFILSSFTLHDKIHFSYAIIKPVLKFGLIMIPGTLALISMRVLDRYMLTYLSPGGMFDVGIYAMGYRVGAILQFLLSIVSMAFFPYALKNADKPFAAKIFNQLYVFFLASALLLGFLIIAFSKEIFYLLVDQKYTLSAYLVVIGVVSTYFHGIFNILNLVFYKAHRAGKIAIAVILGTILNIILNFLLIPKFGPAGAGYSSIIAYGFIVLYNFYKGRQIFKVAFKIQYAFLGALFLILISFAINSLTVSIELGIVKSLVVIVIFMAVLFAYKNQLKLLIKKVRRESDEK